MSRRSRAQTGTTEDTFLGEEREWLVQYCRETMKSKHYDYFIFGHRHLPIDFDLGNHSRYINLGDWINFYTYAELEGQQLKLLSYTGQDHKIIRK